MSAPVSTSTPPAAAPHGRAPGRAAPGAFEAGDTSPHTAASGAPVRSFARRRLWLGISGVGASVLLALGWLIALLLGLVPLPTWTPAAAGLAAPAAAVAQAVALVLAVFVAHALVTVVLEYRGGAVVVRQPLGAGAWFGRWLRGVSVQAVLLALLTTLAASAGVLLGSAGVAAGVLAGSLLLLAAQGPIARLIAALPVRLLDDRDDAPLADLARAQGVRPDAVRVVDAPDEAFVGGWIGVAKPTLWVPAAWTDEAHRELLTVQLARRQVQFASGARRRGVLRAALWPALGVLLVAPLLPWAPTDAAFWLALPAVSTLWMFLGVLLLPSLSRPVVYSADAVAAARLGREPVQRALRQLDAWQDDEPERSPGVEFTFHPVPSRGNRERALSRAARRTLGGAHQLTRLSLFTSLAAGSLLGRVVHCNIGRPALWAVYPGD